jgi:hypothetical protein
MTATDTIAASRASTQAPSAPAPRTRGIDRERTLNWLAVGLPTLVALGLCLYDLTTRSLWLDEAATVAIASQHGGALGAALAHDGGNMLGYYALLHVLIGWFGSGAFVIRIPSVIFAAATVAVVASVGLRLFGRRVAVMAGLLTAVSLTLVYWGQDARGYGAMVAFVAAGFLAFVALLEPEAGWRAWLAYVVLMTAAVYCGLEAALVIPAQLVVLAWRRGRWRAVLSAIVVAAACCVPLAVLAADRGSGQLFWVPAPSFRVLRQIVQALTSSGLQPNYYTSTTTALLVLTLLILAAGAVKVAVAVRRHGVTPAGPALLTLSWLLVPGIVAAIESTLGQSIFQARYLLVSLPAVSLLAAWTLTDRRLPRLVTWGAAAALITLQALQLAPAYGVSSENWRAATSYVVTHTRGSDCVAFYPSDDRQAFRYYLTRPAAAPRPILPAVPWQQVRPFIEDYASLPAATVARLPARCGRVWLVASHEGKAGGPPISSANYRRFSALTSGLRAGFPRTEARTFGAPGVATVTLYSR